MLLEGSYKKDIEKILDALKVTRRGLIRDNQLKVLIASLLFTNPIS
jgi:stalled ribosome alternative rescue factor ArfA